MRLFTAVPLNFNVQDSIAKILKDIPLAPGLVKWVVPSQAHLTLRFLDEQEDNRLPEIVQCLKEVATGLAPFEVHMGGSGAFPSLKKPRVLFIPVTQGAEALAALNARITESLGKVDIPPAEKEFHAHVTLGRVKTFKDSEEIARQIQAVCPENLGKIIADHFALFRSELTTKGPVYTVLEKFKF